ncbi:response regulator [Lyngbya aestuarii]|uniref:response regulator n=1 Tax=Lyngbya aestuarii TaxID=118322 RepID=UPI00403E2CA8
MAKILIIEDEPLIRLNIEEILASEKYTVMSADNGSSGANFALSFRPDLIICDISMPGFDGYQVLGFLQKFKANIPFIFLTARSSQSEVAKGKELGASEYLTKPFKRDELLGTINRLISICS